MDLDFGDADDLDMDDLALVDLALAEFGVVLDADCEEFVDAAVF